ncbi:MAG: glycoside hydrolase family 1 protein [Candidatus Moraniibacteriota bacterium]
MQNKKLKFPENFLWGAATAAHQVEGGTNNDWTEWEKNNAERLAKEASGKWQAWQQEKFPEMFDPKNYISGRACDHYNRFEEDFDLAKSLGHNAHRFSIEWSRIEPEEGKFDEREIEHYRHVLQALRARGMDPFVTLWHWTEPVWFGEMGGWTNKKSVEYFARFAEKMVGEYKDLAKFWVVVNEPNVNMGFGYYRGTQPPGKKGLVNFLRGFFNLLSAFKKAALVIKKVDPKAEIGVANSITHYDVKIFPGLYSMTVFVVEFFSKYFLRRAIPYCTFIGCNYYSRYVVSTRKKDIVPEDRNDLGWEIYPKGIYHVLKSLKKYNLPVYITENGLADADDTRRAKFIIDHLKFVHQAISEGVDVRGYLHWSLLDNFEFPDVRGFWPRFGLIEIDYKTLERKIRPSALEYSRICQENAVEIG